VNVVAASPDFWPDGSFCEHNIVRAVQKASSNDHQVTFRWPFVRDEGADRYLAACKFVWRRRRLAILVWV